MAKYFLGSVGTAEAFKMVNGKLEVAFVSKTLTDSGINISTTKDDLRAGTGAAIVASFFHDPSVEITLTDVMFKTEYVEAQLGADFEGNASAYQSETLACVTNGALPTLAKTPLAFSASCEATEPVIWFTEKGKDNWARATSVAEKVVSDAKFEANKTYCVRYLAQDDAARAAEITSNIIPQELYLIITAPIFAGDACSASNGKQAGFIQYEVPRFRLAGAQDFAHAMSSNQTLSLSGSAMAIDDGCEANGSKLLRIIEVITDRTFYDGLQELVVDEDCLVADRKPAVYGLYKNGSLSLIDNAKLYFDDVLGTAAYVWAAGNHTIKIKEGTVTKFEDTVIVA